MRRAARLADGGGDIADLLRQQLRSKSTSKREVLHHFGDSPLLMASSAEHISASLFSNSAALKIFAAACSADVSSYHTRCGFTTCV